MRSLLAGVSTSRLAFIICAALLPLSLIAYYPSILGDYDVWFHLAYGKHYVQNLTWSIDHTQFSWTPTIPDWKYVTWLSSGIFYLIYSLLDIPGLYILQWIVLGVVGGLMLGYLRRLHIPLQVWHLFCLLLVGVIFKLVSVFVKPEMFTTLFFAVTVAIYFWVRAFGRLKLFFWYPVVFVLWVNSHGGFIMGLFFLTFVFGLDSLTFLFSRNRGDFKPFLKMLGLAVGLSYLAVMLNPYGILYQLELARNLLAPEYFGSAGKLYAYFKLWDFLKISMNSYNFVNSAWGLMFMVATYAGAWVYVWRKKGLPDVSLLFLNIVFFLISMNAGRAVLFYPPVWFFSLHYMLWKAEIRTVAVGVAVPTLALFLFLSGYCLYLAVCISPDRTWFGYGYGDYIPKNAADYIMKHNIPGPLFNDYLSGGYMLWYMYPEHKVFVDPRYGPYVKEVLPDWFGIGSKYPLTKEGLDALLTRYPCKSALVHVGYPNVILWFAQHPDWCPVYFDKTAVVLMHRSGLSELSKEALETDLSTGRFRTLKNPAHIMTLFNFYSQIGVVYAREIRNLYATNVSDLFKFKEAQLGLMDQTIAHLENIKQQQSGAKP